MWQAPIVAPPVDLPSNLFEEAIPQTQAARSAASHLSMSAAMAAQSSHQSWLSGNSRGRMRCGAPVATCAVIAAATLAFSFVNGLFVLRDD